MAYVTYDWYINTFPGGKIPNFEEFATVIVEAEAYIDDITRGKITEATDEVKKAACAVAEVIYKQAHDDDTKVNSESVGNHSKTYANKSASTAEREAEKARKARLYLSRTGLLYRGLK